MNLQEVPAGFRRHQQLPKHVHLVSLAAPSHKTQPAPGTFGGLSRPVLPYVFHQVEFAPRSFLVH